MCVRNKLYVVAPAVKDGVQPTAGSTPHDDAVPDGPRAHLWDLTILSRRRGVQLRPEFVALLGGGVDEAA